MSKSRTSIHRLALAGVIAGVYAALTLFLPIPQYSGVQLRVAEAMPDHNTPRPRPGLR